MKSNHQSLEGRTFAIFLPLSKFLNRSAAILGIEPSPSKFIQDIVKIAIEDSRDSFREIISSYTVRNTCTVYVKNRNSF